MKHFKLLFSLIIFLALSLRLIGINQSPPSLYWEEAALGYDAYSLLETGKDLHGQSFPITSFQSFGDYKPSGYFYFAAACESIFGLTPLGVRLPSVLAGVGLVWLAMLLAKEIFKSNKQVELISLLSGFLVAVSPWAIQFSRAAFEANLAAFFSCLGIYFLLRSKLKPIWIIASVLPFTLSLYTYHSSRIFVPLIILSFLVFNYKSSFKQLKTWAIAGLLGILLTWPLLISLNQPDVQHRFQETSAFNDLQPIIEINQQREQFNNSLLSRAVFHRYWSYTKTFLINYSNHFNLDYLFLTGDTNRRHSTGETGIFYPLDALFLVTGLLYLLYLKQTKPWFLLVWWLLALVPAGLTLATPHALRTLSAIPAPQIILAAGFVYLLKKISKPKLVLIPLSLIYLSFVCFHLYNYFFLYPKTFSSQWQYGYQQLMQYLGQKKDQYNSIYITNELGRASIYYFFYNQVDPQFVQAEENTAKKDQGERLIFQNLNFFLTSDSQYPPNSLIATTQKPVNQAIIYQVNDLLNQPIFYVYQN